MILASYCKLGLKCTYKCGTNEHLPDSGILKKFFMAGKIIPVCPEVFGALTTPRDPSEIIGGNGLDVIKGHAKILSSKGIDVTDNFIKGAFMALDIAQKWNVKGAILTECSPSCGVNFVYDGTFTKKRVNGPGVLGALLLNSFGHDFILSGGVTSEDEFEKIFHDALF